MRLVSTKMRPIVSVRKQIETRHPLLKFPHEFEDAQRSRGFANGQHVSDT